jgi:CHASE3 domain sensor protein
MENAMSIRLLSRSTFSFILLLLGILISASLTITPAEAASLVNVRPDGDDWQYAGFVDTP